MLRPGQLSNRHYHEMPNFKCGRGSWWCRQNCLRNHFEHKQMKCKCKNVAMNVQGVILNTYNEDSQRIACRNIYNILGALEDKKSATHCLVRLFTLLCSTLLTNCLTKAILQPFMSLEMPHFWATLNTLLKAWKNVFNCSTLVITLSCHIYKEQEEVREE